MSARLFVATASAALFASVLSAQQNVSSTPDRPRLTLTGCVEHADEVKRPIASDTTLDSLMFVLIRALPSTSSPSAAARAVVGTSGTMPRTYRLDASVETLGTHVGQQVEVTGVLAETPTSPAGAGSTANLPRLLVERVKVIEPACPR